MRILSQDGIRKYGYMDFPYEMCALSMGYAGDKEKFYIYAHMPRAIEQKIAEYSTEEKAKKAMDMLQKAYSPLLIIKDLGSGIEADIKPNDWKTNRAEPTGIRENYYFRFPEDDEIGV